MTIHDDRAYHTRDADKRTPGGVALFLIALAIGLLVYAALCATPATDPADAAPRPDAERVTTQMSWYGDAPGEAGGPIACGTGKLNVRALAVAMRRDSGVKCGQRIVLCADDTGRCVWVRVLDRGPFVAGRDIDALPRVVQLLGLSLSRGVYRVSWRPVPTSATRGCLFPAWVGRVYYPECER